MESAQHYWAARAALVAPTPSSGAEGIEREMFALPPPVANSAMESWMQRAGAKQLHVPWQQKRRDYADELVQLHKAGLREADILARRQHLNPPDSHRTYSSIRAKPDVPLISGLGWGRGRLDSQSAWCPSINSNGQWMEMDLQEETKIFGLVTQGQAQTGCSGTRGVCEALCPPPHRCKGGGEVNYVTRVRVKYAKDRYTPGEGWERLWLSFEQVFDIGKGGDARCAPSILFN